jgi:hypothetical protein
VIGYQLLYSRLIDDRKVIIESLSQFRPRRGSDPPQGRRGLLSALGLVKKRVVEAAALHRDVVSTCQSCNFSQILSAFLIPTNETPGLGSAVMIYVYDNEVTYLSPDSSRELRDWEKYQSAVSANTLHALPPGADRTRRDPGGSALYRVRGTDWMTLICPARTMNRWCVLQK